MKSIVGSALADYENELRINKDKKTNIGCLHSEVRRERTPVVFCAKVIRHVPGGAADS